MNQGFKRHITSELLNWKNSATDKPIILRGARQVGKTTLVRSLGELYPYYIELNLEKEEDRNLIERSSDVKTLMDAISLQYSISQDFWPQTLLFIDEIQESPKAISFLRYFYEEIPQLHVIAAGSLLEHALKDVVHFPVGRINYLYLSPLNFQEYLEAIGKSMLLDRLKSIPIDDTAHNILLNEFHTYCIIGGMPEIVAHYATHKDISALPKIYESIWHTYKEDITKYAFNKSEENILKHIVNTSAAFVDKRVTFQNFGHSNYKSREVSGAFTNLDKAKVIQVIYPSTDTTLPIIPDYKKSPRLQFLDTGILNFDLNIQADMLLMDDLSHAYKGTIIPHIINQELLSLNTTSYKKTNFWVREKTQSSAEVDLLFPHDKYVIPIEIKSGKTGKLRSLHQFINQANHPYAVRMYAGKFQIEEAVTPAGKPYRLMNLPYYLGTYLEEYLTYFLDESTIVKD